MFGSLLIRADSLTTEYKIDKLSDEVQSMRESITKLLEAHQYIAKERLQILSEERTIIDRLNRNLNSSDKEKDETRQRDKRHDDELSKFGALISRIELTDTHNREE